MWKDGQAQTALQHYSERLELADVLLAQDPSDANLRADRANALLGKADILLNAKDPAVQNWDQALNLANLAVTQTERRDPRPLSLLSQALRLKGSPGEALLVAEQAAKLLPPVDKRTEADKQTAEEIAFELAKSKAAASLRAKGGNTKRR